MTPKKRDRAAEQAESERRWDEWNRRHMRWPREWYEQGYASEHDDKLTRKAAEKEGWSETHIRHNIEMGVLSADEYPEYAHLVPGGSEAQ